MSFGYNMNEWNSQWSSNMAVELRVLRRYDNFKVQTEKGEFIVPRPGIVLDDENTASDG